MFDLSFIRKSVQDLSGQVGALRAQIEKLKQQREDTLNAPIAKADLQAMVARWVISTRDDYVGKLRVTLQTAFKKPDQVEDALHVKNRMTLVGASQQVNGLMHGGQAVDGAMCTFMGEQIIAGLDKAFMAMEWPGGGLPAAERRDAIRKLDKKIGELQAQEAELVSTARAAGIIIE